MVLCPFFFLKYFFEELVIGDRDIILFAKRRNFLEHEF
jgi:hypothetical protein